MTRKETLPRKTVIRICTQNFRNLNPRVAFEIPKFAVFRESNSFYNQSISTLLQRNGWNDFRHNIAPLWIESPIVIIAALERQEVNNTFECFERILRHNLYNILKLVNNISDVRCAR